MLKKFPRKVMIKGAGDLASGVAHRLYQAGFNLIMLELAEPLVVRRSVAFATAVYEGFMKVEGVEARCCQKMGEARELLAEGIIPVLIDPQEKTRQEWAPDVFIDAILAKRNTGTTKDKAPLVIGLGPGFVAGEDVHAVVETQRGHNLGKVYYAGSAAPNTGSPGEVAGFTRERLLRAPAAGKFSPRKGLGELVRQGEIIALIGAVPLQAEIDGLIRGLLYPGLEVQKGMKVGDIDPRGQDVDYRTISDKARAVGGGVLEAILHFTFKWAGNKGEE